METALVIGASGGIGSALCRALSARQVDVTGLSRRAQGLDVTSQASVDGLLDTLKGPFDLIFVATGALEIEGRGPEKALRELSAEALEAQFRLNCLGPALILRHAARLMPRDRECRFAALSARVGSIGDNALGGWYSYRTAKAALNQMVHGAAIELARSHKRSICVALHPGTVETGLTQRYARGYQTVTPEAAAAHLLAVLEGLTPAETGGFFDWQGQPIVW